MAQNVRKWKKMVFNKNVLTPPYILRSNNKSGESIPVSRLDMGGNILSVKACNGFDEYVHYFLPLSLNN